MVRGAINGLSRCCCRRFDRSVNRTELLLQPHFPRELIDSLPSPVGWLTDKVIPFLYIPPLYAIPTGHSIFYIRLNRFNIYSYWFIYFWKKERKKRLGCWHLDVICWPIVSVDVSRWLSAASTLVAAAGLLLPVLMPISSLYVGVCVCAPSSAPIQTTLLTPRPSSHRLLGFRGEIITSTDPIYNGESIKTHWHWYRILLSIDTHSDVAVCDGQDQYIGL